MKLRVVWVGRTKDAALAQLTSDFLARAARFVSLDITELKDPRSGDSRKQMAAEEVRLLDVLDSHDRVVLLDVTGKTWTSPEFATLLGKHFQADPRRLTFVIGGYSGVSDAVKRRADLLWSLSAMTFTHEMARLLVAEQLYRALAVLNGHPYSK